MLLEGVIRLLEDAANSIAERIYYPMPNCRFPPEVTEQSHYVAFSSIDLSDVILYAMKEGYTPLGIEQIPNWEEFAPGNNAELRVVRENPASRPDVGTIRSKSGEFSLYLAKSAKKINQLNLPLARQNAAKPRESLKGYLAKDQDVLRVLDLADNLGYKPTRFFHEGHGTSGYLELKNPDDTKIVLISKGFGILDARLPRGYALAVNETLH